MAGEPGPVGGFLALLDPLLRRPALVVEADDGAVRPGERGDDEADPRIFYPLPARILTEIGSMLTSSPHVSLGFFRGEPPRISGPL